VPDGPSKSRDRDAELRAIDGLIDRLVPALTARLGATHLGELEVREGDWRIRLRRPPTAGSWNGELRRSSDRGGRAAGTGGASVAATHDPHRIATPGGSNGASPGAGHATHTTAAGRPSHEDEGRRVATSPAVGVFRPNARATVGTRVRQGDVLGHVDVLGIREDVLSPADGLVGELLTDGGTAVEYGQELLVIALAASVGTATGGSGSDG
jgi:biotin carboxyl carrier protein